MCDSGQNQAQFDRMECIKTGGGEMAQELERPNQAIAQQHRYSTSAAQRAFIEAFRHHGNVRAAADAVRGSGETGDSRGSLDRSTIYRWRKNNAEFREAMQAAADDFADGLESRALARIDAADAGTGRGNIGSDLLLLAYLNQARPEKWRPSSTGTGAGSDAREALAAVRMRLSSPDGSTVEIEAGAARSTEAKAND